MTTSETLRSVTRDPTDFIEQEVLEQILAKLRTELANADLPTSKPAPTTTGHQNKDHRGATHATTNDAVCEIHLAAALHRFVYTRSDYGDSLPGGLNRPPRETLVKDGNCADQSLLLYALFREAGINARITSVDQIDGANSHAFVECGFDRSPQAVIDMLSPYYRETGVVSSGQFHYFEDGGMTYFIADPVASRHLGERSGLEEMGYLDARGRLHVNRRFQLYGGL